VALCHLHPLVEVDLPPFVDDFHPKKDFVLDKKTFIFSLACSSRLSFDGPSSMVYELLQDCFIPDDFANGFDFKIYTCGHIICGHVPPLVSCTLVAL
jgi:hypothetical protein